MIGKKYKKMGIDKPKYRVYPENLRYIKKRRKEHRKPKANHKHIWLEQLVGSDKYKSEYLAYCTVCGLRREYSRYEYRSRGNPDLPGLPLTYLIETRIEEE